MNQTEIAIDDRLYRWVNGTPGTGIAQAIEPALDPLTALLTIRNSGTTGLWLLPDSLILIPTVLPAAATRSEYILKIDTGDRYDGVANTGTLLAGRNLNQGSAVSPSGVVYFGAVTTLAEIAPRTILRGYLSPGVMTVGKEYPIRFDDGSRVPVIIRPGHCAVLHVWHPSNAVTPASWEVQLTAHQDVPARLPVA